MQYLLTCYVTKLSTVFNIPYYSHSQFHSLTVETFDEYEFQDDEKDRPTSKRKSKFSVLLI